MRFLNSLPSTPITILRKKHFELEQMTTMKRLQYDNVILINYFGIDTMQMWTIQPNNVTTVDFDCCVISDLDVPVFEVLAAVGLIFGFWWNLMAFI
jgi:hypothetical protein